MLISVRAIDGGTFEECTGGVICSEDCRYGFAAMVFCCQCVFLMVMGASK